VFHTELIRSPSLLKLKYLIYHGLDLIWPVSRLYFFMYYTPGDLIISENMSLRDMLGLEQLQSVGGDLIINSNMNLLSLDGLQVAMVACLRTGLIWSKGHLFKLY